MTIYKQLQALTSDSQLLKKYTNMMYTLSLKFKKYYAQMNDVIQDAIIKILEKKLDIHSLYNIVNNLLLNKSKSRKRTVVFSDLNNDELNYIYEENIEESEDAFCYASKKMKSEFYKDKLNEHFCQKSSKPKSSRRKQTRQNQSKRKAS
jgi:DNA-directed RNA polymerase specialized sigma24 family protein